MPVCVAVGWAHLGPHSRAAPAPGHLGELCVPQGGPEKRGGGTVGVRHIKLDGWGATDGGGRVTDGSFDGGASVIWGRSLMPNTKLQASIGTALVCPVLRALAVRSLTFGLLPMSGRAGPLPDWVTCGREGGSGGGVPLDRPAMRALVVGLGLGTGGGGGLQACDT